MSIVAISQNLGSLGDEIGRELARTLFYEFADRAIILKATERFGEGGMEPEEFEHLTEGKLTLWERFSDATRRYLTYIEAVIWEMAARDNVILAGRGAPFVLRKVRHALKVRVTAPERLRANRVEHQQGLTTDAAAHLVRDSDHDLASRIKFLYHVDWDDPLLYDLVLNTEGLAVKEGVQLIQEALQSERFRPTPDSLAEVKDLSLTARATAALLAHPITRQLHLSLICRDGLISISGMVHRDEQRKVVEEVVGRIPRVIAVRSEIALVPPHLIPE